MDASELKGLRSELDAYLARFRDCFATQATAVHLDVYVSGQLGPLPRKSAEPIALHAGVPPRTLQEFFSIHKWSAEEMGSRVRRLVAEEHAYEGAIGILDETSYAKQGKKTVGVQRQYCGEVGGVANCVVSVDLTYAARDFHTLVDADLYLPQSWIEDKKAREAGGVPPQLEFRTKWQIGLSLLDRTRRDGLPMKWVTADEGYGEVPAFLQGLDDRDLRYMVEVPCSTRGWTPQGLRRGKKFRRADAMWGRGGPAWTTYRVKDTEKGPLVLNVRETIFHPSWDSARKLRMVITQNVLTNELKYFLSNDTASHLGLLLTVAFSRWMVERSFEDAKQEIGLGHFEMRKYHAIQRHFAVSMVSLLFLKRAQRSRGAEKTIANALTAQAGDGDSTRSAPDPGRDGEQTRAPGAHLRVRTANRTAGNRVASPSKTCKTKRRRRRPAFGAAMPAVDLALDVAL
jgi:SRSO17 transposase